MNVNLSKVSKLILFCLSLHNTPLYKSNIVDWLESYFGNGVSIYDILHATGCIKEDTRGKVTLTNKLYFEYAKNPDTDYYFSQDIKAFSNFNDNYYTDRFLQLCLAYISKELNCSCFVYKIKPQKTEPVESLFTESTYFNVEDINYVGLEKIVSLAQSKYFEDYLKDFLLKGEFKKYIKESNSIKNLVIKKLNLSLKEFVLVSKVININDTWYIVGNLGAAELNVIRSASLLSLIEKVTNGTLFNVVNNSGAIKSRKI